MLALGGLLLVIVAVISGYLLEHGNLLVLFQPAELIIILGAAIGSLIAGNSLRVVTSVFSSLLGILRGERYGKKQYLDSLKMLHDLFASARRNGAAKLEADIEDPQNSPVFSACPGFLKDKHALHYVCDTLRVVLMGGVAPHEIDSLMELDAETQHSEAHEPVSALQTMADALPGLGIVAAVLGIVVTMGALGGPASEIGRKVAAALVGTFLGVLLCYGFIGPLSHRITAVNEAEHRYLMCLRQSIYAYVRGCAPLLSAEFGRRAIPPHLRPSFQELEAACKAAGAESGAKQEAAA
jgi:chemotaxis protein MotA